jgi:hypothetical protein
LGKSVVTEDESVVGKGDSVKGVGVGSEKRSERSKLLLLQGDELVEFRRSVKKVELPSFDGEDPARWISRVEVYFRVQDTNPEVKVHLAQL